MKPFMEGDFVVAITLKVPMLIVDVNRRGIECSMDRFTLQSIEGIHYYNIGAYELRVATEDEVKTTMKKAGVNVYA